MRVPPQARRTLDAASDPLGPWVGAHAQVAHSTTDAKQAARDVANKKAAETREKAKAAAVAKEAASMRKISSFFKPAS